MASYYSHDEEITLADIVGLNTKQLNRIFKIKNMSKYESIEIIKLRRKLKMRKYRKESRERQPTIKELTKKRDFLQDELRDIEQEIINLEKLLHEPTRVDDSEYGQHVNVDWATDYSSFTQLVLYK